MPTIKQVAAKAGVSVATVSYVLNSVRKVRPETKERVMKVARALRYSPNTVARGLVTGRSSIVGLIVPDIQNPFFPEIATAFQEAAETSGMEAIVINTNYDKRRIKELISRLASLQMPGAAFFTSRVSPAIRTELASRRISAVYLDNDRPGPYAASVLIDYDQGIRSALDHLVQLGHRRIALIGGPADGISARKRKAAFLQSSEQTGGLTTHTVDSDFTVEGGYASCASIFDNFEASAIIAANDLMAIGALHCAYDRRVSVPRDLSIVGFDDIMFARFTQPSLTTVAVPRREMGRLAFEMLWELVSKSSTTQSRSSGDRDEGKAPQGGTVRTLKTELIVRETTAAYENSAAV